MELTSFSFKEPSWSILAFKPLHQTNLLVGRNASGKSKTLKAMFYAASYILQNDILFRPDTVEVNLSFNLDVDNDGRISTLSYSFSYANKRVVNESMIYNGEEVIIRNNSVASILEESVTPPEDKLIIHVRRDVNFYPLTERLVRWAENVRFVPFGDIGDTIVDHRLVSRISNSQRLFDLYEKLSDDQRKNIIVECQQLGFNIQDIVPFSAEQLRVMTFREEGIIAPIPEFFLSDGMIRTIYLLFYIKYVESSKVNSMLLIDDLGEGLDYRRSVDLGKKIFDICKNHNVQLFVTSNDSFLMDAVDLEHWNILHRNGNVVNVINQANKPELFRRFKMTGLSNFDLFSSDFIESFNMQSEKDA